MYKDASSFPPPFLPLPALQVLVYANGFQEPPTSPIAAMFHERCCNYMKSHSHGAWESISVLLPIQYSSGKSLAKSLRPVQKHQYFTADVTNIWKRIPTLQASHFFLCFPCRMGSSKASFWANHTDSRGKRSTKSLQAIQKHRYFVRGVANIWNRIPATIGRTIGRTIGGLRTV